jgi:predicted transcriptional regulator YdeE
MPLLSPEPTTIELPELLLAGACNFANFFENNQWSLFGNAWERLMMHVSEVPNRAPGGRMFGLELYPPEFCEDKKWYYCACVEVTSLSVNLPPNLLCRFLPAAMYAKFSVQGNVTELAPAFRYIYDEWLPKSGVKLKGTYDLEMYDAEFKGPCDANSITHLLLPLL